MKNTIKAILCFALALLFVFTAVSCSNGNETAVPEQGTIDVEKRTYENKSIGLGLRLKEGWTIKSTEELQTEVNKLNFDESLKTADIIYNFYAVNDKGDNVIILFENTKKNNNRVIGEKEYMESYMNSLESTLAGIGITLTKIEELSLKIDKNDYKASYIESTSNGEVFYQYELIKQIGEFMTCITITAHSVNDLNSIFYCFYSL